MSTTTARDVADHRSVPLTDEPDDYSRHEILHLTSVIARLIDNELAEHPAMKAHPQWLDRIYQVSSELADLYQLIGEEHLSTPGDDR